MDRPGVRTPLVHDPVGLRRRAAVRQHLVGDVLQHDGVPGAAGQFPDHPDVVLVRQQQIHERLAGGLLRDQLLDAHPDQHLVDLGRRLDEGNLVGESHQGQADRLGLLDHGLRHGVEHAPGQFHDEDGRVRVREPPDEG